MSQNLRHLAACRNADRIVVFFPEGNRSASGTLQPFREGLTFFAQRSQLPVIPGWIEGAYQALPKGRRWPRRTRVKVQFGPMLAPPAEGEAFVPAVRDAVLRLQPQ
jgi:1-acyl-sn-glycerol-3-phosphate acyltransferase